MSIKYRFLLSSLVTYACCCHLVYSARAEVWVDTGVKWGKGLAVQIELTPRDGHGDFGMATFDMSLFPGSQMLVSLEPIVPGRAFKPLVQEIPLKAGSLANDTPETMEQYGNLISRGPNALEGEPKFSFDVPKLEKDTLIGLFICRDSAHNESCAESFYIDARKMGELLEKVDKPSDLAPGGRVYFFKPILVKDGVVHLPIEMSQRNQILTFWQIVAGEMDAKNDLKVLSKYSPMDFSLWGGNLVVKDGVLTIPMSYQKENELPAPLAEATTD